MQHDYVIDGGSGDVVLLDMQQALQALATCSAGPLEPTTLIPGMFWLDTSVAGEGFLRQRNRNNSAWATVIGMPAKASAAEAVAGIDDDKYVTPAGLAQVHAVDRGQARNRIINGSMLISQENAANIVTANGAYPADMWSCSFIGGAHNFQRVASPTPLGNQNRLRWTVTTAQAVMAASGFTQINSRLEGLRVADLRWGYAEARRVILRFGFRGPAGTYSAIIRNGPTVTYSYVKDFTIDAAQANLDTQQTIIVPGPVAGGSAAWPIDNTCAMQFSVSMATGTTYQGAEGAWLSGNFTGTANGTNNIATVGNVFELFDVGLYRDLDGSGIPPRWQPSDPVAELQACQRYYALQWICNDLNLQSAAGNWYVIAHLPVDMRAAPTQSQFGNNAASAQFSASAITYLYYAPRTIREFRTGAAIANAQYYMETVAVNARM